MIGIAGAPGAGKTTYAREYAALLHRLRVRSDHPVYAPGFERDLEQPIAAAVTVPPETEVVVTEGNYLLLDLPEWRAVRAELDEVWFVEVDDVVRRARLVARHVAFGKSPADAERWVAEVDDPNALLVASTRGRADRLVAGSTPREG